MSKMPFTYLMYRLAVKGVIYENNTYKVSQNRFSNMCEDILGVSIENKAKSGVQ